jgi:hypothetical protein
VLEPNECISEVLFASIMVLTFPCSLRLAEAGRDEDSTFLSWTLNSGTFRNSIRPDHFRYGTLQEKSPTRWQSLIEHSETQYRFDSGSIKGVLHCCVDF